MHRLDGSNGFVERNNCGASHHPHVKSGFETALPQAPVFESGLVIIILKFERHGLDVKAQQS